MSGMHMLPVYYTTTNQKKRRKGKKSKRLLQAEIEHEKYLRKMGYDPNAKQRKPTPLKTERVSKPLPDDVPISEMDWSPCLKGKKSTLSGNYVVGQAYNKGNLVVLSKSEASDVNTGKRR